ncbi:MAG: hypothetical protein ACREKL_00015 [Chthoniobacterales bacterium]
MAGFLLWKAIGEKMKKILLVLSCLAAHTVPGIAADIINIGFTCSPQDAAKNAQGIATFSVRLYSGKSAAIRVDKEDLSVTPTLNKDGSVSLMLACTPTLERLPRLVLKSGESCTVKINHQEFQVDASVEGSKVKSAASPASYFGTFVGTAE